MQICISYEITHNNFAYRGRQWRIYCFNKIQCMKVISILKICRFQKHLYKIYYYYIPSWTNLKISSNLITKIQKKIKKIQEICLKYSLSLRWHWRNLKIKLRTTIKSNEDWQTTEDWPLHSYLYRTSISIIKTTLKSYRMKKRLKWDSWKKLPIWRKIEKKSVNLL